MLGYFMVGDEGMNSGDSGLGVGLQMAGGEGIYCTLVVMGWIQTFFDIN